MEMIITKDNKSARRSLGKALIRAGISMLKNEQKKFYFRIRQTTWTLEQDYRPHYAPGTSCAEYWKHNRETWPSGEPYICLNGCADEKPSLKQSNPKKKPVKKLINLEDATAQAP